MTKGTLFTSHSHTKTLIKNKLLLLFACGTCTIQYSFDCCFSTFRGNLWYISITSQNESLQALVTNFFISQKGYVPFSRYSNFCIFNHSIIYQICVVMMSIRTWDRVHSWIYLLNLNSLSHETWPIDRYKEGQ